MNGSPVTRHHLPASLRVCVRSGQRDNLFFSHVRSPLSAASPHLLTLGFRAAIKWPPLRAVHGREKSPRPGPDRSGQLSDRFATVSGVESKAIQSLNCLLFIFHNPVLNPHKRLAAHICRISAELLRPQSLFASLDGREPLVKLPATLFFCCCCCCCLFKEFRVN